MQNQEESVYILNQISIRKEVQRQNEKLFEYRMIIWLSDNSTDLDPPVLPCQGSVAGC